jgi:hypothetical protein
MTRIPVLKTYKLLINGTALIRPLAAGAQQKNNVLAHRHFRKALATPSKPRVRLSNWPPPPPQPRADPLPPRGNDGRQA